MHHLALKQDLERHKLELIHELEEQRKIINDATAYAKHLENALSATNLALGTMKSTGSSLQVVAQ